VAPCSSSAAGRWPQRGPEALATVAAPERPKPGPAGWARPATDVGRGPGRLDALRAQLATPDGRKLWRYSLASVVSVVVSLVALVAFDGLVGLNAVTSSTLAVVIATIPSYELNRKWAWGRHGKSHLMKEVVPFWAVAIGGWALSSLAVAQAEHWAHDHHFGRPATTLTVAAVWLATFTVLWIAKFVFFNRVLFKPPRRRPLAVLGAPGSRARWADPALAG
jgi:putative flippase GtrA